MLHAGTRWQGNGSVSSNNYHIEIPKYSLAPTTGRWQKKVTARKGHWESIEITLTSRLQVPRYEPQGEPSREPAAPSGRWRPGARSVAGWGAARSRQRPGGVQGQRPCWGSRKKFPPTGAAGERGEFRSGGEARPPDR